MRPLWQFIRVFSTGGNVTLRPLQTIGYGLETKDFFV
jgi:hypothetical protein